MKKILICCTFVSCLHFCYAQSGNPDPSFGVNGIIKTNLGAAYNYKITGKQVLVQADGTMYLVDESAQFTIINKRKANGAVDSSYGTNGYSISIPLFCTYKAGGTAAVQGDGKIVVAGSVTNQDFPNYAQIAVARFNINGSLDSSFAGDGIAVAGNGLGTCLAIQSDGKIVVGGTRMGDSYQYLVVIRCNTDGSFDNGIDTHFDDGNGHGASSVAIQTDGKIVVADHDLVRFKTNFELDSSFNGNGHRAISRPYNLVALQSDGKIVVAGQDNGINAGPIDIIIARYNANGSTDSSFGINGIQNRGFDSTGVLNTMSIQADGKILVAGSTGTGDSTDFAVARYKVNGNLDSSFSGDGLQITKFGLTKTNINSIAIQTDGKILALGNQVNGGIFSIAATRYDSNGNPDNSFDGDGKLTNRLMRGSTFFTCTAVQTDGKILAGGYAWNGSNYDFALVRYNTNGSLDSTFSGDGKQMTDFGPADDKAAAIAIQNDGKIVLAGAADSDFGLARYNTDGSPDNSFNGNGKQTTDFGAVDRANSIAVQPDGKLVAGGSGLARYNIDGTLDVTFDGDGRSTTPLGGIYPFSCNAFVLQNDGKIVVSGNARNIGIDCIIARYNTDGSVDHSFGDNGIRLFYAGDYITLAGSSLAVQNDGKIVIGGYSLYSYRGTMDDFLLNRINGDGSYDTTFKGPGNIVTGDYGTSVVVGSDNKIFLGGNTFFNNKINFSLARYKQDGTLDSTFSDDGIVLTEASPGNNYLNRLAISGDSLYAAGYGQFPDNSGIIVRYLVNTDGTCTSRANGDWNDPATWVSGTVPVATSRVIVKHAVTITTNTTCYSLKVEPAAGNLVISTGVNLTITH